MQMTIKMACPICGTPVTLYLSVESYAISLSGAPIPSVEATIEAMDVDGPEWCPGCHATTAEMAETIRNKRRELGLDESQEGQEMLESQDGTTDFQRRVGAVMAVLLAIDITEEHTTHQISRDRLEETVLDVMKQMGISANARPRLLHDVLHTPLGQWLLPAPLDSDVEFMTVTIQFWEVGEDVINYDELGCHWFMPDGTETSLEAIMSDDVGSEGWHVMESDAVSAYFNFGRSKRLLLDMNDWDIDGVSGNAYETSFGEALGQKNVLRLFAIGREYLDEQSLEQGQPKYQAAEFMTAWRWGGEEAEFLGVVDTSPDGVHIIPPYIRPGYVEVPNYG
jgi:hypothetical protein